MDADNDPKTGCELDYDEATCYYGSCAEHGVSNTGDHCGGWNGHIQCNAVSACCEKVGKFQLRKCGINFHILYMTHSFTGEKTTFCSKYKLNQINGANLHIDWLLVENDNLYIIVSLSWSKKLNIMLKV